VGLAWELEVFQGREAASSSGRREPFFSSSPPLLCNNNLHGCPNSLHPPLANCLLPSVKSPITPCPRHHGFNRKHNDRSRGSHPDEIPLASMAAQLLAPHHADRELGGHGHLREFHHGSAADGSWHSLVRLRPLPFPPIPIIRAS
jgi:hypothetical protein